MNNSKIYNPVTKRFINVNTNKGMQILQRYISQLSGGAAHEPDTTSHEELYTCPNACCGHTYDGNAQCLCGCSGDCDICLAAKTKDNRKVPAIMGGTRQVRRRYKW